MVRFNERGLNKLVVRDKFNERGLNKPEEEVVRQ